MQYSIPTRKRNFSRAQSIYFPSYDLGERDGSAVELFLMFQLSGGTHCSTRYSRSHRSSGVLRWAVGTSCSIVEGALGGGRGYLGRYRSHRFPRCWSCSVHDGAVYICAKVATTTLPLHGRLLADGLVVVSLLVMFWCIGRLYVIYYMYVGYDGIDF